MTGIGQARVFSTEQILCCVVINDHPLEILLHVLPDHYSQSDVMLGREILNRGFAVNMTATELSLTKVVCVVSNESDNACRSDLTTIATDVTGNDKSRLLQTLDQFSEFLITGLPTTLWFIWVLKKRLKSFSITIGFRECLSTLGNSRACIRQYLKVCPI